jgi:hypothetical protein
VTTETTRRYSLADNSPQAAAERNVPHNPRPLCTSFVAQPAPAEFWCRTCGWNRPMHDSDEHRAAIAAELERAADHHARLAACDHPQGFGTICDVCGGDVAALMPARLAAGTEEG